MGTLKTSGNSLIYVVQAASETVLAATCFVLVRARWCPLVSDRVPSR
jgi:hypothetical protein